MRNRIETRWTEQTQDGTAQSEFPKVPEAKYTPADIKRLFGDSSSYGEADYWVNVIAFREGKLSDAADVGDRAGLSVGIFQWTQKSGRLGELMQKYKDVAANDGKLEEFYKVFGGKEKAENLLAKLNNPSQAGSVPLSEIKPLFTEAARHDVLGKRKLKRRGQKLPDISNWLRRIYRIAKRTAKFRRKCRRQLWLSKTSAERKTTRVLSVKLCEEQPMKCLMKLLTATLKLNNN